MAESFTQRKNCLRSSAFLLEIKMKKKNFNFFFSCSLCIYIANYMLVKEQIRD